LKIVVPKESLAGETRVALLPNMISTFTKDKHEVWVESGCGSGVCCSDSQYKEAGAKIVQDVSELYQAADVILKVNPPRLHPQRNRDEVELFREGCAIIGFLAPLANQKMVHKLVERKITSFAFEYVPRITRAQSMDALSSMATIAGYKAVLLVANRLGKIFPLLMTAAGTIPPAVVLVLGAGVAGLQAIATAKRLGAKVEAFDPRPAVKEQVQSLGATFVEMELPKEDVQAAGGYAKEQSDAFLRKEQEAIGARLGKVDAIITTAQIFGKKAPILITEEMVKKMWPGSVIVDIAAEQGGNCALTEADQTVERDGVTIIGTVNLPAAIPVDASLMYGKNIINLFRNVYKSGTTIDFNDEVSKGSCITHNGQIMNDAVKKMVEGGK
jgi:NAD(P) transhydrogenase subunit alpha